MKYRFQDNTLPFEERAKDLLSRLTREEKVGMITSQLVAENHNLTLFVYKPCDVVFVLF